MGTPSSAVSLIAPMAAVRFLLLVFLGDVSGDGDGLWGRQCLRSTQCAQPWSHCARKNKEITAADGECRLNIWVWVLIILIPTVLLSCVGIILCCCYCKACRAGCTDNLPFKSKA